MFNKLMNVVAETAEAVSDVASASTQIAIGQVKDVARDATDIVSGLSVGELRARAALRLGATAVADMSASELIDVVKKRF